METFLEKKYIDESWYFEDANTKTLSHCFHNYPAMMIPQVAARLLEKYGKNVNLLFDPYCGTGTSLARISHKNSNRYMLSLFFSNSFQELLENTTTTIISV